ncbi:MAG: inositol monophosphatase, partial [Candidatus Aenigmatarchaeota archaeon]
HNFIRNINIFGVSVGVVYKRRFIFGCIYMPIDKELYVGEKGNGAYKNGKKISVSLRKNLKDCSISFDSSIRYSPSKMLKVLGKISKEVFNIRMFGSSARVLSYIAEGKLDLAVEFYDRPWDFAGGVCLIEEAGGRFTDLRGAPITHNTIGYIASNGIVHKKVERIISSSLN